jgi:hypothetical protein
MDLIAIGVAAANGGSGGGTNGNQPTFVEFTAEDILEKVGLSDEELEGLSTVISDDEIRKDKTWSSSKIYGEVNKVTSDILKVAGLTPDDYEGTDTEKLQACFDALATTGGVISINREYVLTDNIKISHDSSANNNLITVVGTGKKPRINFGAFCFMGADTTKHSYGGLVFKDLWLSGEQRGFDCSNLIRITFDNCMIRRFTNFVYSDNYIQSVYLMGCYVRNSLDSTLKAFAQVDEGSNVYGSMMDVKIIGCVCESGIHLVETVGMAGCQITGCCIEGYTDTPIIIGSIASGVEISGNYFETNKGTSIDLSSTTDKATICIENNYFCEYQNDDEYIGIIKLPTHFDNGYITVIGNHCSYSYAILLHVPEGTTDLSKVYAFSNFGTTNNTDVIKMLTPTDIYTAVENQFTDEQKAEVVDAVKKDLSGETWKFTLSDGKTIERVIPTVTLAEFDSETWTFVLADGTTVEKAVGIT